MDQSSLYDLLAHCTVRLAAGPGKERGTGFFVAPGLVLTCAHVVEPAWPNGPIMVHWGTETVTGRIEANRYQPGSQDLALLRVELPGHPCVFLQEAYTLGDELLGFGYPEGHDEGDPVTATSEDWLRERGTSHHQPHLKFKQGQVQPGLSGAPFLNRRTGGVCGVVRLTRDRSSDLGGRAIPASTIFRQFGFLIEQQQEFHSQTRIWVGLLDEAQRKHGGCCMPEGVTVEVGSSGRRLDLLRDLPRLPPLS